MYNEALNKSVQAHITEVAHKKILTRLKDRSGGSTSVYLLYIKDGRMEIWYIKKFFEALFSSK
jgi:hypothetical protein